MLCLHQHNCNDWSQVNFPLLYKIVVKNLTLLNNSSPVPAVRRDCQENPTRTQILYFSPPPHCGRPHRWAWIWKCHNAPVGNIGNYFSLQYAINKSAWKWNHQIAPSRTNSQKSPQITVCPRIGKITCFCCDPALMHFVLFFSRLPVNVERLQVPTQLATAGACLIQSLWDVFSSRVGSRLRYDLIHNKTHSVCV